MGGHLTSKKYLIHNLISVQDNFLKIPLQGRLNQAQKQEGVAEASPRQYGPRASAISKMMKEFSSPQDIIQNIQERYLEKSGVTSTLLGEIATDNGPCPFIRLKRKSGIGLPKILLSAGIHGDEPAGPHAVMSLLQKISDGTIILPKVNLDIFPLINPSGFLRRTRTNQQGKDLNRCFSTGHPPKEIRLMMDYLKNREYDLSVEFHEDIDTKGFYLYEHQPVDMAGSRTRAWGAEITTLLRKQGFPINESPVIEGMPAVDGVISPRRKRRSFFRRHGWPQAFYMHKHGTKRTLTLETPPCLSLEDRTKMHIEVFLFALKKLSGDAT
jgi:hypothetical protein